MDIDPKIIFRLIIGKNFEELKKVGYIARNGLKPIPVSIPMKWESKDDNLEFNLHAWRFFNPCWEYYVKNSTIEIAEEVIKFIFPIIKDWNYFKENKRSHYIWYDMAVGIRAMHLGFLKYLIDRYKIPIEKEDVDLIETLICEHVDWLSQQNNITKGNHALYEIIGLRIISAIAKIDTEDFVNQNINKLIDDAFDEYAVSTENSPFYHGYNISILNSIPDILFPNISQRKRKIIKDANVITKWLTGNNGLFYRIGDTEGKGVLLESQDVASNSDVVYKDLYQSGYQIIRSNPNAQYFESLIFKGAPASLVHAHADALSFIFYYKNKEIFSDPGKFTYENNEFRKFFVGDRSHNTAGLREINFLQKDIFEIEENINCLSPLGVRDGTYILHGKIMKGDKFKHIRRIEYTPFNEIIIYDEIDNYNNELKNALEIRFLLGLDIEYNGKFLINKESGESLKIDFLGDIDDLEYISPLEKSLWISSTYKSKENTAGIRVISFSRKAKITTKISYNYCAVKRNYGFCM